RVNEVQSGSGPPVAQDSRLGVLRREGVSDLPYREVVRRPPVGVDPPQLVGGHGPGGANTGRLRRRTAHAWTPASRVTWGRALTVWRVLRRIPRSSVRP